MVYIGRNEGGKIAYLMKELNFLVPYFSLPVSVSSSISGVLIRKHTEEREIKKIYCYKKIKEYLCHRRVGAHHFSHTSGETLQTPNNSSTAEVVPLTIFWYLNSGLLRTLDSFNW